MLNAEKIEITSTSELDQAIAILKEPITGRIVRKLDISRLSTRINGT
jgi:hypothetical protein